MSARPPPDALAAPQQALKKLFVQRMRLLFVGAAQCSSAEWLDAEVAKLADLCRDILDDIPQAVTAGQLGCQKSDELGSARERAELLTDRMLVGQNLKFMSRENSNNLRKNSAKMGHGLELLFFSVFLAKPL